MKRIPIPFAVGLFVMFCLFFVIAPLSHCQSVDIIPSRPGQFTVLGRSLQFGVSGNGAGDCSVAANACGVNNNFVFPALFPQESLSLSLFNSCSSNQTAIRVKVSATNDPAVTQFQNNQARWSTPVSMAGTTAFTTGAVTINAGTGVNLYAQISGGSQIAIVVTNSTVIGALPCGLDMTVSQIQTQSAAVQPGSVVTANTSVGAIASPNLLVSQSAGSSQGTQVYTLAPQGSLGTSSPEGFGNLIFDVNTGWASTVAADSMIDGNSGGGTFAFPPAALAVSNGGVSTQQWDRVKSASIVNKAVSAVAGTALPGIPVTTSPLGWSVPIQATTASNCSASVAATASIIHCATGVEMCVSATVAQAQLFINLRDGATGAGQVKWNGLIAGALGTFGCVVHEFAGGPVCGSTNTAMTLELGANTGATNGCASTLKGFDIQ